MRSTPLPAPLSGAIHDSSAVSLTWSEHDLENRHPSAAVILLVDLVHRQEAASQVCLQGRVAEVIGFQDRVLITAIAKIPQQSAHQRRAQAAPRMIRMRAHPMDIP